MPAIRVVPVLDLKGGLAVHAVRGERARYVPVRSVLADSADPVAFGLAFRDRLGARECYVADLDAIAGAGDHRDTLRGLAGLGLTLWLDAGVADAEAARRALDHGATRVVVGTETLRAPDALPSIAAAAPGCLLSLDLRDGRLLGGSAAVTALDPETLARAAWDAGFRAFIVLDLARVGGGGGPDPDAARRLRAALPGAEIVVGGGVRHAEDLRALERDGVDAALVATALHTGALVVARRDA